MYAYCVCMHTPIYRYSHAYTESSHYQNQFNQYSYWHYSSSTIWPVVILTGLLAGKSYMVSDALDGSEQDSDKSGVFVTEDPSTETTVSAERISMDSSRLQRYHFLIHCARLCTISPIINTKNTLSTWLLCWSSSGLPLRSSKSRVLR